MLQNRSSSFISAVSSSTAEKASCGSMGHGAKWNSGEEKLSFGVLLETEVLVIAGSASECTSVRQLRSSRWRLVRGFYKVSKKWFEMLSTLLYDIVVLNMGSVLKIYDSIYLKQGYMSADQCSECVQVDLEKLVI